jgi:hypothetical protein
MALHFRRLRPELLARLPDLSYGDAFLYLNTNVFLRSTDSAGNVVLDKNGNPIDTIQGKLFFELPLKELKAGAGFNYRMRIHRGGTDLQFSHAKHRRRKLLAAHVDNATMRIYSSKGTDSNYFWRERSLKANWPTASNSKTVKPEDNEDNVISAAPDSTDWISEDHRILGATKVGSQLWFA